MITRHEILPDFSCPDIPGISKPEDCLFFDIETTGLAPAHSYIFIIGSVCKMDQEWVFTQWMSEVPSEEGLIIEAFSNLASSRQCLIHFNGTTFDIPFIKKRSKLLQIPFILDQKMSYDLYQMLKIVRKMYPEENLKQITLEKRCGYFRPDQLSGKDMIKLYQRYVGLKEAEIADLLLGHNHDDLIGMLKILPLLTLNCLTDGAVHSQKFTFSREDQMLSCAFVVPGMLPDSLVFSASAAGPSGALLFLLEGSNGTIHIPAVCAELKHFFPDYKNYYYLPYEDQAIHKSVGTFLDKDYRKQARPETCYIKKQALFLPQFSTLIQPYFKNDLNDQITFFEWNENVFITKEQQDQYLAALIPYIFNCLN